MDLIDPGITREMLEEAKHLAKQAPATNVTIRIPRDHPQAEALLELVRVLSDEYYTPTGLTVKRPTIPGAEDALLVALRRIGAPVDEILEKVGAGKDRRVELLKAGLNILTAIGAMSGRKDDVARLVDHLGREL